MSDIFITEKGLGEPLLESLGKKEKKPRKQRKPLTEEQKDVLRERLAKAREAKKNKSPKSPKEPKATKEPKAPEPKEPKETKKKFNIPKRVPAPDVQKLEDLKLELQLLKEANSKKELADLQAQVNKLKQRPPTPIPTPTPKPAPTPTPAPSPIETKKERNIEPKIENYSTYKKSIWAKLAQE